MAGALEFASFQSGKVIQLKIEYGSFHSVNDSSDPTFIVFYRSSDVSLHLWDLQCII
jgi:hypothetical protein